MSPRTRRLPSVLLSLAALGLPGVRAEAQRATIPLLPISRTTRFTLPDVIAVRLDADYRLVAPALFERKQVFRNTAGVWSIEEAVVARDSVRAAAAVEGRAVAIYVDGIAVGTGRVREVRPDLCGVPPGWCLPRIGVAVNGTLERDGEHPIAVSPPPGMSADVVEPSEDEVGAASRALFATVRTALGPRVRVREDQLGGTAAFAVEDRARLRRLVVASAPLEQGPATRYVALVIGSTADTLLREAAGRAPRIVAGPLPELQLVSALDLNGDGGIELLLGWRTGAEWSFEVITENAQGRWQVVWSGPDMSLPAAPVARPRRR